MPVRPRPRTYCCTQCGWQRITHPVSDVLRPGDHFSKCPQCGGALQTRSPTALDELKSARDAITGALGLLGTLAGRKVSH